MTNVQNKITLKFKEQVKSLIAEGKAANREEIVSAIEWNKSQMSQVMTGARNIPVAVYRKFTTHFGLKPEESPVIEPGGYSNEDYIMSLRDQISLLKEQVSWLKGEMRHIELTNQAILQANQDLLIEIVAKQKRETVDDIALIVGKAVAVNYERAKKMDIVPSVGK
jgi:hypothetical protein